MQEYRKTSHATYDLKYHLVWITKYRKPVFAGGYFAASSGNVTDEVILEYIKNQDIEENQKADNFTIE